MPIKLNHVMNFFRTLRATNSLINSNTVMDCCISDYSTHVAHNKCTSNVHMIRNMVWMNWWQESIEELRNMKLI